MKVVAILICIFSFSFFGFSQNRKNISFELGGIGGIASLNFEHNILNRELVDLDMRYGFSVAPIDKNNGVGLVFPVMIHSLIGRNAHKIDLGIGQGITITTKGSFFALMPASFGYRFQPAERRYYLRAAYTPLISYLVNFQWQHWGGITFGYQVNKQE